MSDQTATRAHEEIFAIIREILVEQLGDAAANAEMTSRFVEDLNSDSLDIVEMIMEIEDKFSVKIPDEDAHMMATVGDAVNYVYAANNPEG